MQSFNISQPDYHWEFKMPSLTQISEEERPPLGI
jgi:hypothetical protein